MSACPNCGRGWWMRSIGPHSLYCGRCGTITALPEPPTTLYGGQTLTGNCWHAVRIGSGTRALCGVQVSTTHVGNDAYDWSRLTRHSRCAHCVASEEKERSRGAP